MTKVHLNFLTNESERIKRLTIIIIWGTIKQKIWAWWGSISLITALMISLVITCLNNTYSDILTILRFPSREMVAFQGLPLQGYHFIFFFGIPLSATIYLIYPVLFMSLEKKSLLVSYNLLNLW